MNGSPLPPPPTPKAVFPISFLDSINSRPFLMPSNVNIISLIFLDSMHLANSSSEKEILYANLVGLNFAAIEV
jgi:hypothetical protein